MHKRQIPASLLIALGLGSEGCEAMVGPCLEPPAIEHPPHDDGDSKDADSKAHDDAKPDGERRRGKKKKINLGDGYCLLVPPSFDREPTKTDGKPPNSDGKAAAKPGADASAGREGHGEPKGGMARSDVIDALVESGRLPTDVASRLRGKPT